MDAAIKEYYSLKLIVLSMNQRNYLKFEASTAQAKETKKKNKTTNKTKYRRETEPHQSTRALLIRIPLSLKIR